jgi:hypothetical protein
MFGEKFHIDFLHKVWDMIICWGWPAIYWISLAILKKSSLMELHTFHQIMERVVNVNNIILESDQVGIAVLKYAHQMNKSTIIVEYSPTKRKSEPTL